MTELKQKLLMITKRWRRTALNTRLEAPDIPNLLARGHMHGLSDGLDLAAEDVEAVVNKDTLPPAP